MSASIANDNGAPAWSELLAEQVTGEAPPEPEPEPEEPEA